MKVVSLFSGAGGLDLGFVRSGAQIIWANDIDPDSVKTYAENVGDHIVLGDIEKIKESDVPDADAIIGGFPCLGFTVAKGKSRTVLDPHNFLYLEFLRITKYVRPKYFLIENVPGMIRGKDFKNFFEKMIQDFVDSGYTIKYKVLRAADYGVPQTRDRVIIVGARNDIEYHFEFPDPTHSGKAVLRIDDNHLQPWVTLKEAIGDLPQNYDERIPNHAGTKHKVKINGYVGNRVLYWDKPSPTIMGRGSRTGGPVIHPHPSLKRRLSVRETARIQSFPDNFIFFGSISSQYAQVGNAVPPLLAFRLGQQMMRALGEKPRKFDRKEWKLPWVHRIPEI